jgi:2-methylcitrate dehydratase PrpD
MLRRDLDVDEIAAIKIRLPPTAFAISGRPVRGVPSAPAAIASAAYGVAAAFVRGGVSVANYAEETRRDNRLHELIDRTEVTVCEALPDNPLVPQTLVVSLRNGEQLREECRVLLGSPMRRLSATAFEAKLRTCAEAAITPVSTDRIARFPAAVENSANCADVLGEFLS